MPRAATTVIKPFLPSSLPPPWSSHHTARLTRRRKLSGSNPPPLSPLPPPPWYFSFVRMREDLWTQWTWREFQVNLRKGRRGEAWQLKQSLQTTIATTTIRIFLIKVFFQWNLLTRSTSAGAAGGRQELRFTVHSVYCTNTVFKSSLCTNYCSLCTTTANYCSLWTSSYGHVCHLDPHSRNI